MTKLLVGRWLSRFTAALLALSLLLGTNPSNLLAGNNINNGRQSSVGGISVDAEGVVKNSSVDSKNQLRALLMKEMNKVPADLNQPVELRMISMKGLEAAVADAQRNKLGQLPDELKYLAGLQRIEYVFAVPELGDIVLAGPAEGWKLDQNANVVGVTTGRPVIQLEDLVMAFRTVRSAREGGISCSIDPTPEGRQNLDRYFRTARSPSPAAAMKGMQDALGMQKITLNGVPTDSHFARVLVAADYHMKRIAMNLDPSPVKGLPGFLDLVKQKNVKPTNLMPRWWLACNYEPLLRSPDGLNWQIKGQGVKAMTEDDFINQDGSVTNTGKKSPLAQQWADLMTAKYDELSKANIVFGELRNVMDLCVVAALIEKEGLMAKVGLSVPLLTDSQSELTSQKWNVPKMVATQCSFISMAREFVVTASGGVQIDSFGIAQSTKVASNDSMRAKAVAAAGKAWWWQ